MTWAVRNIVPIYNGRHYYYDCDLINECISMNENICQFMTRILARQAQRSRLCLVDIIDIGDIRIKIRRLEKWALWDLPRPTLVYHAAVVH